MLSRALSLATVTLLIGCFAAEPRCAGDKSRGRQKPLPDFRGHLQCLPQEPAWPAEDRAGVVAAGLPAPALHHQQRHGLGARLLSGLQRRRRHALSGQGSAKDGQAKGARQEAAKPDGKPDQLDRFGRRQNPAAPQQEASRPDAEGRRTPQGDAPAATRKRLARPGQAPDAADRRPGSRQAATDSKMGKRGSPAARQSPSLRRRRSPTRRPRTSCEGEPSMRPPRSGCRQERSRQGRGRQAG